MKVFVAMLAAGGFIVALYVIYEVGTLRGDYEKLDVRLRAAAATADDAAESSRKAEDESPKWDALDLRLARIEEKLSAAPAEGGPPEGPTLATIEAKLATQGEEIAEIRKDLEGVRRVRGALDSTADRLLGAVGQDAGSAEGSQGGGLDRLMELGSLFQKRPEDLTEEERARRDEITNQLRRRQSEWAVRSFERSLEVKLNDQQRADIQQILEEERAALDATRGQDLTDEARTAARKQVEAQTDQKAAGALSAEQYESWKSYRSRSNGGRSFGIGRFGRGE
jgi:hypothetical protein